MTDLGDYTVLYSFIGFSGLPKVSVNVFYKLRILGVGFDAFLDEYLSV